MKLVSRLKLTAESWFDTLTEEQKKAYVKEHPNSKYAKIISMQINLRPIKVVFRL